MMAQERTPGRRVQREDGASEDVAEVVGSNMAGGAVPAT